jgi:peptidoglycan hydrolase-like protein with peptidoglycan-binding domain
MHLELGNEQELLKEGASGPLVRQLQEKLAGGGFNPGQIDGIYGPKTREAVIQFQNSKGLAPDGIVGTQTWGALNPAPFMPPPPIPRTAPVYGTMNWMDYLPWIAGGVVLFLVIGAKR